MINENVEADVIKRLQQNKRGATTQELKNIPGILRRKLSGFLKCTAKKAASRGPLRACGL
jgi:hypothetical protein